MMELLGVDISLPDNNELEILIVAAVYDHLKVHGQIPNLKLMSKIIGIPERTLQRKLFSENCMTYDYLITQIRKQLISVEINSNQSLRQVSASVGFSCFSSLQKFIFNHWGIKPREFRIAACKELNSK